MEPLRNGFLAASSYEGQAEYVVTSPSARL